MGQKIKLIVFLKMMKEIAYMNLTGWVAAVIQKPTVSSVLQTVPGMKSLSISPYIAGSHSMTLGG
jgi:hypothetical protein